MDTVMPITVIHMAPVGECQDDLDLAHLWGDEKEEAVGTNVLPSTYDNAWVPTGHTRVIS